MPRLNRLARVAFVASVMFAVSRVKGVSPRKHKITTKRDRSRGLVEHANIRLWAPLDRVLSVVWVTPNVHKIHHSRDSSETNSNDGNVLSIYDRMFGTFMPTEHASSVVYGLDDADPVRSSSLPRLLAMPFLEAESVLRETRANARRQEAQLTADRRRMSVLPDRKVRNGSKPAR
ncbi:MAG: hypothetical protein DMG00_16270 [Acidobacteria bacterium]|nr:MAG: hypothetical protein DMG00_16270 [Acidobacteriota bacterium]